MARPPSFLVALSRGGTSEHGSGHTPWRSLLLYQVQCHLSLLGVERVHSMASLQARGRRGLCSSSSLVFTSRNQVDHMDGAGRGVSRSSGFLSRSLDGVQSLALDDQGSLSAGSMHLGPQQEPKQGPREVDGQGSQPGSCPALGSQVATPGGRLEPCPLFSSGTSSEWCRGTSTHGEDPKPHDDHNRMN